MLSGTATAFIEAGMFFAVMQGPFYAGTGCTNTHNILRILSYQKKSSLYPGWIGPSPAARRPPASSAPSLSLNSIEM